MATRSKAHAARVAAYKTLCAELSEALYEDDPARTGSSVGAAPDQYDREAARLSVDLRSVRTRAEVRWVVRRMFGSCSPALLDRVERALDKFRLATETKG